MSRSLARVEVEFERIGLLLEHDKVLPSATALIAGAAISGSWWGHPQGHQIYAALNQLAEGSGRLCAKLVDGKRTYVHPRLYPAFFALLEAQRAELLESCSQGARELWKLVERSGPLRLDRIDLGRPRERTAWGRELEARVLVSSVSEHTAAGKHEKRVESWSRWRSALRAPLPALPLELARRALLESLDTLARGTGKRPRAILRVA